MPVSHRGSMASSRGDAEHSQARYLEELEGLEVTEELTGFDSDEDDNGGGGRGHLLNVGDTMSDIGRVVSQTEAGMDFTTNLEAPMEGVRRRATGGAASARSSVSGGIGYSRGGGAGLGLVNGKPSPYEDMSMSRLADSYWRPDDPENSGDNVHTRDDLGSMEFSTQSAAVAAVAVARNSLSRGGEEGETGNGVFYAQEGYGDGGGGSQHQHQLGSFYSDSHYQQQRPGSVESGGSRPLPRRPESYHDGPSTSSQQQPLPTFSSTNDSYSATTAAAGNMHSESANDRLARLVARYSGDPRNQQRMSAATNGDQGYYESSERPVIQDISSEALSDDGMLQALPDTPDVHTAFTSIGHFSSMHSDAAAPANGRSGMVLDPSIVERTRTALQQRIASSESPGSDRGARLANGGAADGPSYSEMRQRFLGRGTQQVTRHQRINQSMESLDHPNLGSQGSMSPGHSSLLSMTNGGETGFYGTDRYEDDGRFMRPIDGDSDDGHDEFGHSSIGGATGEHFNPIEDADALFGDHFTNSSSSNPDFADIVRDHERVFSDLFDSSSDSGGERDRGPYDSTEAPASLFASSSSIVAEISRRQAQGKAQKKGKLSTWDGREATPDAMRRQELLFGVHTRNPIEMQGKVNSLGLEDHASDVSGLLPESEHSPPGSLRGRSNTASLAQLGRNHRPPVGVSAFPITPQSAPLQNGEFDAPPPTTPTTFISRDTKHGPSTRVLHQVPPFDPLSPPNGLQQQQQPTPATLKFRDEAAARGSEAPPKRPAGPRSIDQSIGKSTTKSRPPMLDVGRQPTADQRRNVRAAAQFAQAAGGTGSDKEPQSDVSSHGLGSLFMDSLPVLDASRIGNSNKAAGATPPPAFHALSRILNSSGHTPRSAASPYSSTQNSTAYVPFQDPTVDISTLPKYQDVDLKQQRQGSTRQVGPPPGSAMSNLYSATPSEIRDVTSAHGSFAFRSQNGRCLSPWSRVQPHKYDDSDMVATVRYDSPSPPTGPLTASLESLSLSDIGMEEEEATSIGHSARRKYSSGSAKEGPTLRDIYNLLKKTVTSIDAQQQKEEDVSMHVVPRQLQSQTPEYRPTAPTPRRSRHFPSQYRDASSDSDSESRMLRGRSDTGQSRVRAYLQRYISESAASHPPPPPPAEGAEKMLADILSFVSGDGQIDADLRAVLSRKLPPALADKLRELAGVLAQATTAKEECKTPAAVANEAVQTDDCVQPMADKEDAGLRLELLRLQRDILAKFDEYRAEVDQLRCEVRRASSSPSVAPHDSVSVAGRVTSPPATPTKQPSRVGDRVHDWRAETVDDDSQSETSTTVPGVVSRSPVDAFTAMGSRRTRHTAVSPWDGHSDLLATREALDAIRAKQGADDGFARHMYGREVAQQLAATLAELQRVHVAQFHGPRSASPCAVCRALEAQNHDPYLFGRRAVAYRSLTTRQLQGLLNAYVAAMQDHQEEQPQTVKARMSYTPTRAKAARSDVPPAEPQASKVVGLLRDELDALSRRYHRLVDEFRRLDPSRESDQRRRKQMSRELKDLVDVLDVKGEQIAILAQLHPEVTTRASSPSPSPAKASKPGLSSTQRALQSARELQSALGDLY